MMEFFDENSVQQLLAINYFRKKAPSLMFCKVLNTPLNPTPFLHTKLIPSGIERCNVSRFISKLRL